MNINRLSILLSRIALFLIYFWFGLLKVIGQSPASTLVQDLLKSPIVHKIFSIVPFMSQMSPSTFVIVFGVFEMIIGILFIIPGWERIAVSLFAFHMITTILPLFLLSEVWTRMFVPTLEGQYIIKNIALIACALNIWASL